MLRVCAGWLLVALAGCTLRSTRSIDAVVPIDATVPDAAIDAPTPPHDDAHAVDAGVAPHD
jgi:hypothetical protein